MSSLAQLKKSLGTHSPETFLALKKQYRQVREAFSTAATEAARLLTRGMHEFGPPHGYFSTYEQLLAEGRQEQIILPGQKGVAMPEDSICVRSFQQHLDQPHPILWKRYENARLVSESLALVNPEKKVNLEACYGAHCYTDDPAYRTVKLPKPIELRGKWTSVISRWVPCNQPTNYAHWFYDALPRLNLLKYFPEDVGILIPSPVLAFHKESLKILGLYDRARPTPETHVRVEEYYFSSPVSMIVCWSPYAYDYLNEHILPAASGPADTPKRFYIERRGVTRGALNADELRNFFEKIGWAVIDTGTLPLREQINLFKNAEAFCGLHGAGLINMQWSSPGTHVIEIFPSTFLSGGNELIAKYQQLQYKSLVFPGNVFNQTHVDIQGLERYLSEQNLV